ncbi:MAG: hypothetical protein H6737_31585 [Alphaproteobacteria bacterium]|nr:hypothetical protein [Alphaproteobacteria bacterium]
MDLTQLPPQFQLPLAGSSRLHAASGVSVVCDFAHQRPRVVVCHEDGQKVSMRSLIRATFMAILVTEGARSPDRWVSAHRLRRTIWGRMSSTGLMHTTLHRIRASLERNGIDPAVIEANDGLLRLAPPRNELDVAREAVEELNRALARVRRGDTGAVASLHRAAQSVAGVRGLWLRPED